jgi:hypothetical protein
MFFMFFIKIVQPWQSLELLNFYKSDNYKKILYE